MISRLDRAALARGGRVLAALLAATALAACAVTPEPLAQAERVGRAQGDMAAMFVGQEAVSGPITVHEAIARALKYNLDRRLRLMETAVAQRVMEAGRYELLPSLTASAGYVARSRQRASSSESIVTGQQSLEPSVSEERVNQTYDITFGWNLLDFGMSWLRAQEQASEVLIAEEQRRKVVQNVIQDVRSAYWRALSAQRQAAEVETLAVEARRALESAREVERQRLNAPMQSLNYQLALLEATDRLNAMRRQITLAKTELAALMNLKPGTAYELAEPDAPDMPLPRLDVPVERLEETALVLRPELGIEDYRRRFTAIEYRRQLMQLLPNANLALSYNRDENRFLVNNDWTQLAFQVSYNLVQLMSQPARMDVVKAEEELDETRRRALSMAVLTQVHVARRRYQLAVEDFEVASELVRIRDGISGHTRAAGAAATGARNEEIPTAVRALAARMQRDLAYAEVQNAFGRVINSLGVDPLPEGASGALTVADLAGQLKAEMNAWENGDLPPLPPLVSAAPAAQPAGAGLALLAAADPGGTAAPAD